MDLVPPLLPCLVDHLVWLAVIAPTGQRRTAPPRPSSPQQSTADGREAYVKRRLSQGLTVLPCDTSIDVPCGTALHSLIRHSADASNGAYTQTAIARRPRRQLDAISHAQLPRGHPLYTRALRQRERASAQERSMRPAQERRAPPPSTKSCVAFGSASQFLKNCDRAVDVTPCRTVNTC